MSHKIVFMNVRVLLLIFIAAYSYECLGGWFGPNSYEECILEKLKNAHTDEAVALVRRACSSKFSEKSTEVFLTIKLWTPVENDRVKQIGKEILSRISIIDTRYGRTFGVPSLEITVHNKTASNLKDIYVGFTRKASQLCGNNPSDYLSIEKCIGYASPNDVGQYTCFLKRMPKESFPFCVVGLDAVL